MTGGAVKRSPVERMIDVLWALRRSGTPMTVTEISQQTNLPLSTAFDILRKLQKRDLVIVTDRHYQIGPGLFYLGAQYPRAARIRPLVHPLLVQLSRELSLNGVIAIPWDGHHLIVEVLPFGPSYISVGVGGRVPIASGSFGKVFAAATNAKIDGVHPSGEDRGYEIDEEEFAHGVGAVASAVTSPAGFEGLIALTGSISDMRAMGFAVPGSRLAEIAAQASVALGDVSRMRVVVA